MEAEGKVRVAAACVIVKMRGAQQHKNETKGHIIAHVMEGGGEYVM